MITEVHVRKIKDTETGGMPTPLESPVRFEMYKGGTAFKERPYEGGDAIDPIEEWHYKNGTKIDHRKTNSSFNFGYGAIKNDSEEDITF